MRANRAFRASPRAIVVMLSVSRCAFGAGVVVDAEPNDTISTATVTGLIGAGEVLVLDAAIGNGPLGASDRDLYSFATTYDSSPVLLTVTMVAADDDFDGYLRLFDAEGREILAQDDDGPSVNPRLQTYFFRDQHASTNVTYFVAVSHALNPAYSSTDDQTGRDAQTGGYLLSIELTTVTLSPTSLEPQYEGPVTIETVPTTLINQFIGDGENQRLDVDRYLVEVAGPSIVTAEVTPVQLKLLDPIVNGVYEDLRPDLRIRHARFAVFEAGTAEIAVMGTWGAPDVAVGRSVGYYNITIDVTPVSADPDDGSLEPDDSLIGATVVALSGPGTVTYSAYVGDGQFAATRGDIDAYEITLSGTETLAVDVSPTDTLEATVHLYDYLGARLQSWLPDASGAVHLMFNPPPADEPQTFIVVVMGAGDRVSMDPLVPNYDPYSLCPPYAAGFRQAAEAIDGGPGSTGAYDVSFTVFATLSNAVPKTPPQEHGHRNPDPGAHAQDTVQGPPVSQRVFATRPDASANAVVELNPRTGDVVNEFQTPEVPLGLYDGMAYNGTNLYLLGSAGQYPYLYRLDDDTGDVLGRALTWFGSGVYGDMAILDDTLYVVDLLESHVYAMPTSFDGPVRRLEMGGLAGVSMFGAIATATSPDRLLVTDAEDPSLILELDPEDGLPVTFHSLQSPCPCNADFDHDGDVDDDDTAFLDGRDSHAQAVLDCVVADLDCDGQVFAPDRAILNCQYNGPDAPPNTGCCPDDLPAVAVRAASLAAAFPHVLLAGDWSARGLERFNRTGQSLGPIPLADPVGTIASGPLTLFADSDVDGDVDLLDWRHFQTCFTGDGDAFAETECMAFDYDLDRDVDLDDFSAFQNVFTGIEQ